MRLIFLLTFFLISGNAALFGMDPEWVRGETKFSLKLTGDIKPGDYQKIKTFIEKDFDRYKETRYIHLSSNGGSLVEALRLAGLFREIYPTVSVDDKCASACFFMYLSGTTRFALKDKSIGIHRPYFAPETFDGLSLPETRSRQRTLTQAVDTILEESGVSKRLIELMNRTVSTEIYWLTLDEVDEIGRHPAWFEELLIAKCDYGTLVELKNRTLQLNKDSAGNLKKWWKQLDKVNACEDGLINKELSNYRFVPLKKKNR